MNAHTGRPLNPPQNRGLPPNSNPNQVGIIGPDKKFKVLTAAEVQDYLQEVE
jgi:hypothetical protein